MSFVAFINMTVEAPQWAQEKARLAREEFEREKGPFPSQQIYDSILSLDGSEQIKQKMQNNMKGWQPYGDLQVMLDSYSEGVLRWCYKMTFKK